MSTYQILDIALNGTFFATVAAIAVVFVILRDGAAKQRPSSVIPTGGRRFETSLDEATAIMPSAADLIPRKGRVLADSDPGKVRINIRPDQDVPPKLTRAERELIASIGNGPRR